VIPGLSSILIEPVKGIRGKSTLPWDFQDPENELASQPVHTASLGIPELMKSWDKGH
jgi:hypothetical protein